MTATTTAPFPLATDGSYGGSDGNPGDANNPPGSTASGNAAGASGSSTGTVEISRGAMIAIIIVVVLVGIFGIASSVLFYIAKKREWKIRQTIRRSARKVVTALTPRRSEFPRSVKESAGDRARREHTKLDEVPPTPRIKPEDLEKGLRLSDKKRNNFSRK